MSEKGLDLWTAEELEALAEELRQCEPDARWSAHQRPLEFFDEDDDSVWIRKKAMGLVLVSPWRPGYLRERTPEMIRAIVQVFRRQEQIERGT